MDQNWAMETVMQRLKAKNMKKEVADETSKCEPADFRKSLELSLDPMKSNWKTLAETMSIEKIAAIKAKRLANKKNLDSVPLERQSKASRKVFYEPDRKAAVTALAMKRERQRCSREEQLLGEKELPDVLKTLALVYDHQSRQVLDKPRELRAKPLPGVTACQGKSLEAPQLPKYNRYGQERFLKPIAVSEQFGIDTLGSNIKKEAIAKPLGQPLKELQPKCESKSRPKKPIIVVPLAQTSIVTLYNVKELLQEMRYVSSEEMRRQRPHRLDEVSIERSWQGELLRYRVIDNVSRLKSEDWEHVAAVFVLGPKWQFKDWPWQSDPVVICHHVCAFHLRFKETPVNNDMEKLRVNILSLPKYDRHTDCGILMEFWSKLDRHMAQRDRQFAYMRPKPPGWPMGQRFK